MCCSALCDEVPRTILTLKIQYCHRDGHWHIHHCSESLTDEGEYIEHGRVHYDAGPFETGADVLEWCQAELGQVIPLLSLRDNVAPT